MKTTAAPPINPGCEYGSTPQNAEGSICTVAVVEGGASSANAGAP